MFENRVLRGIFVPKRDEVAGRCRRRHNQELHNWYVSLNFISVIKSSRMKWAWNVEQMGDVRNAYNILVEKPDGKKSLGRRRSRWEDNIRMDLGEIW
jgi:hypothetical protein